METIQNIIDLMKDHSTHSWMGKDEHEYLVDLSKGLQAALDRKNKAIGYFDKPTASMAQARRLVEYAKSL